ncbi:MAG TPA: hypothetical protein PKD88_00465 [Nitrosomonas sp.]|nr:hypothetical protein [Nitrosomonas sp.]HMW19457.1 hypothetical protein [Nitrosomonas sp.]HMY61439.1 hypothetical protein [Nitrosomonas sp.]HNA71225.1 hypothetical protein [Nitrosomonas sp.]HNB01342.1 hypothetical protein [Nitrosomonas sp.]
MTDLIANLRSNSTLRVSLKYRTGLALHHLLAAGRSAARVKTIEDANRDQPYGPFWDEILQNSIVVATLTVASLEAYANDLWFENTFLKDKLSNEACQKISELVEKNDILGKFDLVLAISTGKKLNYGIEPVQSVNVLNALRNALVHFRPEWSDEQDKHKKVADKLAGKFKVSPFLEKNEPIFPRAWASKDFSRWALKVTVDFLDHFCAEAKMKNPFESFLSQLEQLSEGVFSIKPSNN